MKKTVLRTLSLMTSIILMLGLAACGNETADVEPVTPERDVLICGVTEFEPMNYTVDNEWTGFDTEFARLVAEKLDMDVKFQKIEWSNKFVELESGAISAIWNGFTANAMENDKPRSDYVDFSYSYMTNKQSVVVKRDKAQEFKTIEDLKGRNIAAESGSAGESMAKEVVDNSGDVIGAAAQIDTFMEVLSGAVDCAIVDVLLANQIAGSEGYAGLVVSEIDLEPEVYAIGFKKGSDLTEKVNAAIVELYEDGSLTKLAEEYGLEDYVVVDTEFDGTFYREP